MKYLVMLLVVSCTTSKPDIPKDINQAYLLGCFSMVNYIAFSGEFTEEQYYLSMEYFDQYCAPYEGL